MGGFWDTKQTGKKSDGKGFWGQKPSGKGAKSDTKTDPRETLATQLGRVDDLGGKGTLGAESSKIQSLKTGLDVPGAPPEPSPLERITHGGGSALGFVLRQVSRPAQAAMSAIAESGREGEKHPLGPLKLRLSGKVATAAREGWNLQRHDTPLSIAKESGDIRAERGEPTGAFGGLAGTRGLGDLRSNPLGAPGPLRGVSNFVYDVGGSVAVDPLTYVTFGTGNLAKSGLQSAEKALGAERAAEIARKGTKILTEAERAKLAETVPTKVLDALDKGAQGGVGAKLPTLSRLGEGKLLSEPRTIIPGAVAGAPFAPLRAAGRVVADTGPARAASAMFRPRDAIRRTFGDQAARALDDARAHYKGTFQSTVEDDIAHIAAAMRQTKATSADLEHIVGPALDIGHESVTVPSHLEPLVDAFRHVRDNFTQAQIDAGLSTESAMHLTDEYLPRVLTDEGRKLFGHEGSPAGVSAPKAPSAGGLRDRFAKQRTFETDKPISEINADFADKAGAPVFEPNPAVSFAHRIASSRKAVATKGFIDDVLNITDRSGNKLMRPLDDFAAVDERLGEGGRILKAGPVKMPDGYVEVNVPRVGKFAAPQELAGEVRKIADLQVNDEALNALKRGLDSWQNLWKGYATVPFIFGMGFHERNAIGNVFNNWLAGISLTDPAYERAMTLQRRLAKGIDAGDALKFLGPKDRELVDAARKYDVIGEGFYGGDLPKRLADKIPVAVKDRTAAETAKAAGKRLNPLSQNNAVIATGRWLGSQIEQNARLAHFIAKADELGDPAAAARSVRKYLFDYSDLTAAEREVFKRINGFYTFTRKNLPLQIEALLTQPGKFSQYQDVRRGLADQAETPEGPYPAYLDELAATPLPKSIAGVLSHIPGASFDPTQQVILAPDLPLGNASDAISPLLQLASALPGGHVLPHNDEGVPGALRDIINRNLVGGAPGALSTGAQVAAGREFFSGREIREGQRDVAPAYASMLPFVQRRQVGGKMQPTLTDRSRFVAEQMLPALGKVAGTFPRGEKEQDKAPRRRLSAVTGVRVYPLGEATRKSEAYRRLDEVRRLIADIEARGTDVPPPKRKSGKGYWSK